MRIIQALGSAGRGGAERFFVRLTKAFDARGISQAVITRHNAWAAEQLAQANIRAKPIWFGGRLDLISRARYKKALKSQPADIAINWMPNAFAACPAGSWVRIARLGKCYEAKLFSGCDHLIASSPRIVAHLKGQGWPSDRLSYIPNFVPEVHTAPVRRAAFNTPDDVPLILWLGGMTRDKAPDVMVRALAATPGAYLWMAGLGPYESAVKKLSVELGVSARTRFLGWRDDIHALLKAADVFVRSALDDGMGNILEAWAHGLPLITARSADAEYLVADGETGLIVPKGEPAAIANAMKVLVENRDFARRLGVAGNLRFRSTFSEEPVVGMYLELCQKLRADFAWRMERSRSMRQKTQAVLTP
jgi:glycosyltransferase involved in cell wall biosynthesis